MKTITVLLVILLFAAIAATKCHNSNSRKIIHCAAVTLPEELNQASTDPNKPDTLYAYKDGDTTKIEFKNYRK